MLHDLLRSEDPTEASRLTEAFALDVLMGLSSAPKHIPSKYFYDDIGSRLFERIMGLPEYYLTGCEREIFERQHPRLVEVLSGEPLLLVELGPGNGVKTRLLLRALRERSRPFRYVPIDISKSALSALLDSLETAFPGIEAEGIAADYLSGLRWLTRGADTRTVVLFLGSNLGNFTGAESLVFLKSLWNMLKDGDLVLIGFDLRKDLDVMRRAYDDSEGVTRDFNLNLLHRINRDLGGDFDVDGFRFYSTFDVHGGSITSYLVSRAEQSAYIEAIGRRFHFGPWEPIRTELSYKYLESDIERLAEETGYAIVARLYDARRYFTDSLWRVCKGE